MREAIPSSTAVCYMRPPPPDFVYSLFPYLTLPLSPTPPLFLTPSLFLTLPLFQTLFLCPPGDDVRVDHGPRTLHEESSSDILRS